MLSRACPDGAVLELGRGYARVLERVAERARLAAGIDCSSASIELARRMLSDRPNRQLHVVDAGALTFPDGSFEVVICIQNGISAFKIDPRHLLRESLCLTRPDGLVLLSSYSAKFWPHRLEWFDFQSRACLLGEIDREATRDGVIVCRARFRATTIGPHDFLALADELRVACRIDDVDELSVFCKIRV